MTEKWLRYSIAVDIDTLKDEGKSKKEIKDWFKSEECAENYELVDGIEQETGLVFADICKPVFQKYLW